MMLKVATATGEKGSYMRSCQKHSECVWAKIIEHELILSVCLKSVCIDNNEECVMHNAKRGGRRVSVTMTLIFFKIVWMCPLS